MDLAQHCKFVYNFDGMLCVPKKISRLRYHDTGPPRIREHIEDGIMLARLLLVLKMGNMYRSLVQYGCSSTLQVYIRIPFWQYVVCSNTKFSTQIPRYWSTQTHRSYWGRYYDCQNAARSQNGKYVYKSRPVCTSDGQLSQSPHFTDHNRINMFAMIKCLHTNMTA
jgi:hypothetical protein